MGIERISCFDLCLKHFIDIQVSSLKLRKEVEATARLGSHVLTDGSLL